MQLIQQKAAVYFEVTNLNPMTHGTEISIRISCMYYYIHPRRYILSGSGFEICVIGFKKPMKPRSK